MASSAFDPGMHALERKPGIRVIEIGVVPDGNKPPGGVAAYAVPLDTFAVGAPLSRRLLQGSHQSTGTSGKDHQ